MSTPSALGSDILVDSLIQEILERVNQLGLTEILLPPSSQEFSEKKLGITWSGKLVLTNGKFRGLQTIHRVGETSVGFNENAEMTFNVDLGLTNPTTTHDFLVVLWKKEMEGVVDSTMTHITFSMVVGLNLLTRRLRLISFKFKELGDVKTNIKGLGMIMDYVASKVTKIIVNRIKWDVATDVEGQMQNYLSEVINNTEWPSPRSPNIVLDQVKRRTM